jgi:hypothetical protein
VQVDPIKPTLKAPGTTRFKLKCDDQLSDFAFNFHLRRYTMARAEAKPETGAGAGAGVGVGVGAVSGEGEDAPEETSEGGGGGIGGGGGGVSKGVSSVGAVAPREVLPPPTPEEEAECATWLQEHGRGVVESEHSTDV